MLEWDHLRIVLAIHRTGSMQAAADTLHIDRTTVLRRLDAMEKKLGAKLFERSSDGCTLTTRGDEVLVTAESIESAMTQLGDRVGGGQAVAEGKVTVTVPEFFAANILAPSLPRFYAQYPNIEVRILCSYKFLNLVRGEADIALRNRWPEQNSLIARKVASVGYGFYASKNYIAKRGAPAGSLAGHDLILLDEELVTMLGYDRMMELASVGKIVFRANEVLPLVAAARADLGVAFMPCMASHGQPELVGVWPGLIGGLRDIFLVARQDLREQARVRAVYDFMANLCEELGSVIAGKELSDRFPITPPAH